MKKILLIFTLLFSVLLMQSCVGTRWYQHGYGIGYHHGEYHEDLHPDHHEDRRG